MKIMKRMLSVLLVFGMMVGLTAPSFVHAQEMVIQQDEYDQAVKELSKALEFYFNEIGHIDAKGNYTINNIRLLKERAQDGNKIAKDLIKSYHEKMLRTPADFGKCIVKDYFGVYVDLIEGKLWDAFVGYLQGEAWTEAAKIILKLLGKSASKANLLVTAGELALAAYNCKGEW